MEGQALNNVNRSPAPLSYAKPFVKFRLSRRMLGSRRRSKGRGRGGKGRRGASSDALPRLARRNGLITAADKPARARLALTFRDLVESSLSVPARSTSPSGNVVLHVASFWTLLFFRFFPFPPGSHLSLSLAANSPHFPDPRHARARSCVTAALAGTRISWLTR